MTIHLYTIIQRIYGNMYAHTQFHIAQNLSYLVIYTLILYALHFEKKRNARFKISL